MKIFWFILLFVPALAVMGQATPVKETYIQQDEKVDEVLKAFREHNRRSGINGFRVQIYTDSGNRSKLRTDRVKAEFDAKYPQIRSYISYDEPYYKLRVGDFRTRLDAQRFLNEISSTYLSAILVVDRINFPRLATDDMPVYETIPREGEE